MAEQDAAGTQSRCSDAKLRLVRLRRALEEQQCEALSAALKRERGDGGGLPLSELPLTQEVLEDIQLVLEHDWWDDKPSGREWVKDWLDNGADWAQSLEEPPPDHGPLYCHLCWKPFHKDWDFQQHTSGKDHRKRQRTWTWRYGETVLLEPPASVGKSQGSSSAEGEVQRARPSKAALDLQKVEQKSKEPASLAKMQLLEYRNGLSQEQRRDLLERVGLPRANDVASLSELQRYFDQTMARALEQVGDPAWVFREPTFSWLSGFYWHPEATCLLQQGYPHSAHFCHLCEVDAGSEAEYQQHLVTRRHADNAGRWVEMMGSTSHPSLCGRCPASSSGSARSQDSDLDLEHHRKAAMPDVPVSEESSPPAGFTSNHHGERSSIITTPYIAVVAKVDRRIHAVRAAAELPIGPREKRGLVRKKRWWIELFWCQHRGRWASLAIPARDELGAALPAGRYVDLCLVVQWGADKPWEELEQGWLRIRVPQAGLVAVEHFGVKSWSESKHILQFTGRGQVEAAGGVWGLRGAQIPIQVATEDVMISSLLYVPKSEEPHPLLLFFHGDMPRGTQNCPQPGLADFATGYGPALMVTDARKHGHPVRDFVVVTPCCSDSVWWLRHPAVHDATDYAVGVERCIRALIELMYELGLCSREKKACFVGQSMGAYMALELARAMPEGTAAVVAGAPCFDACRLDHLAERLVNVPVWLLIGRNDSLCSFEEVASLALKMRDLDAKCVRLTSVGIKGHSEVGKKLEKKELYTWMLNPLAC